jgi:hypothetical protein
MGSITDTSSLSAALETVRQAAALGDERITAHLASFARELAADCEEPADYIHRIGYTVSVLHALSYVRLTAQGTPTTSSSRHWQLSRHLQTCCNRTREDHLAAESRRSIKSTGAASESVFDKLDMLVTIITSYSASSSRHGHFRNAGLAVIGSLCCQQKDTCSRSRLCRCRPAAFVRTPHSPVNARTLTLPSA